MNTKQNITSIILATIMATFVPTSHPAEATGWLSGYSYRKAVTITKQAGAGTNYQVKLLVGKTSGATGENFDLGGHCLDTMLDIRFTTDDQSTPLDYWIESVAASGTSYLATVWVEVAADLSTTNQDIYIYYGKTGDTGGSSIANTFIDGNDFEASPGGTGWTTSGTVDYDNTEQKYGGASSAKFVGSATTPVATRARTAATGYSIMMRFYKENDTLFRPLVHGNGTKAVYTKIETEEHFWYYVSSWTDSGATITADAWNIIEYRNFNWTAYTCDVLINGVSAVTGMGMVTGASATNTAMLEGYGENNKDSWVDNYIVRKWQATEPSYNTSAAEENAPAARRRFLFNNLKNYVKPTKVFADRNIRNYGRVYRLDAVG